MATSPLSGSNSQQSYAGKLFAESKKEDGTVNQDVFFQKEEDALIARGDTDTLLSKIAQNLIKEIIATQSLEKTQEFFTTVNKMSQSSKDNTLLSGYLAFREVNDLQWLALKIAKDSATHKDLYLFQLVEECKKTKNKEIALEAANAISHPGDKAKYLAKINYGNHF
jgi:hypothetical protein